MAMNQKLKDGLITATICGVTVLSVGRHYAAYPQRNIYDRHLDLYDRSYHRCSYHHWQRIKLQTVRPSMAAECLLVRTLPSSNTS